MLDLTFGEQVKIVLSRKGMTIKELAELIEEQTGKKMSRQNLTQRLGRDNFQEQDMRVIAQILGCPFQLNILEEDHSTENTYNEIEEQQVLRNRNKAEKKKAAKDVRDDEPVVEQLTLDSILGVTETSEEEASAEAAAEPAYEAVAEPEHEAVEEPQYEAVEEPQYEAVEEPQYEAAEEPQYEAIEEPVYEALEEPQYEAVEEPQYEAVEEPQYEAVEEPQYEAVEEPQYEAVEEPQYEAVEEPQYEAVEEPAYEAVEEPEQKVVETKKEPEKKETGWIASLRRRMKREDKHASQAASAEQVAVTEPETQTAFAEQANDAAEVAEDSYAEAPRGYSEGLNKEEFQDSGAYINELVHEANEQQKYDWYPAAEEAYREEVEAVPNEEEDRERGDVNPYTGREYETNSVRIHPSKIGYVQVYDRAKHQWIDMTEWAFLGYQEQKKMLLGKDYEEPIYLD